MWTFKYDQSEPLNTIPRYDQLGELTFNVNKKNPLELTLLELTLLELTLKEPQTWTNLPGSSLL